MQNNTVAKYQAIQSYMYSLLHKYDEEIIKASKNGNLDIIDFASVKYPFVPDIAGDLLDILSAME